MISKHRIGRALALLTSAAILVAHGSPGMAQDLSKATPIKDFPAPTAPFFKPLPESFAVQIDIVRKKAPAGAAKPGEPAPAAENAIRQLLITQSGSTRHETRVFDSGAKTERWFSGGTEFSIPAGETRVAMSRGGFTDPFAELRWLSQESYQGAVASGGQQLYSFKETKPWDVAVLGYQVGPEQFGDGGRPPDVTRSAYVDVQTKYPVFWQMGETSYRYTVLPPPGQALQLPAAFAQAAARLRGR